MICRADLDLRNVNNKKEEIFPKHLYKIVRLSTQNIKTPSYHFENKPSYLDITSLELSKLIYRQILNDITIEEKNDFETLLFVRYVHGTTSIEGNTLTEGQTYNLLINDLTPSNKSSSEVAEIRNYKTLKEYLDNYTGQIDERLIKTIHRILVDHVIGNDGKYIPPGKYRTGPSTIGGASCKVTDPEDIPDDIQKLLSWYNEGMEKQIHPLELATIFHHRFEGIHPFNDGNGRAGRALLDIMLKRADFPRIYILWTARSKYLDTLNEGDFKNYVPLIDFIITRMAATMTYLYAKTRVYDILISDSYIQQFADFGMKDMHEDFAKLIRYYRESKELP
jgi:Fic family protein